MAVPESERGEGKFEVLIRANELATYTLKICTNKNVFFEEYQNALTNDIIRTAKDIYIKAYSANEINVHFSSQAEQRLQLQESAISDCNALLALMQIAKKVFHLDSRRIRHWGTITITVRSLLTKWYQNDCERYRLID